MTARSSTQLLLQASMIVRKACGKEASALAYGPGLLALQDGTIFHSPIVYNAMHHNARHMNSTPEHLDGTAQHQRGASQQQQHSVTRPLHAHVASQQQHDATGHLHGSTQLQGGSAGYQHGVVGHLLGATALSHGAKQHINGAAGHLNSATGLCHGATHHQHGRAVRLHGAWQSSYDAQHRGFSSPGLMAQPDEGDEGKKQKGQERKLRQKEELLPEGDYADEDEENEAPPPGEEPEAPEIDHPSTFWMIFSAAVSAFIAILVAGLGMLGMFFVGMFVTEMMRGAKEPVVVQGPPKTVAQLLAERKLELESELKGLRAMKNKSPESKLREREARKELRQISPGWWHRWTGL
eukprot:gene10140-8041_t